MSTQTRTPKTTTVLDAHSVRRISDAEQLRLYTLAMQGKDAKLSPRAYSERRYA